MLKPLKFSGIYVTFGLLLACGMRNAFTCFSSFNNPFSITPISLSTPSPESFSCFVRSLWSEHTVVSLVFMMVVMHTIKNDFVVYTDHAVLLYVCFLCSPYCV